MKLINHSLFLIVLCFLGMTTIAAETYSAETTEESWCCTGYCFLGGDVPTNPFKEFGVCGATEREARASIPCSPYDQNGVVCSQETEDESR
jgi:hypothetical protein